METPNDSITYAHLNKGLTRSGLAALGGVAMAVAGLLTYRQWSDGVAGAGTLLAIGAGLRFLSLAKKAGHAKMEDIDE